MTTIVTRAGKGSALTWAEADANFTNLNSEKLEVSGGDMTGQLGIIPGTLAAPGLDFVGDTNTGIAQLSGADTLAIVAGGVSKVAVSASQIDIIPASTNSINFSSGGVRAGTGHSFGWSTVTTGSGGSWGAYFSQSTANVLTTWTNNVERMRIDASGLVNIGQTALTAQLGVQSGSSSRTAMIVRMAASQSVDALQVQNSGGGVRFQVSPVGNLAAMGAATSATVGLNLGTGGERLDSTGNPVLLQGQIINALSGNVLGASITAETRFAGAISSMQAFSSSIVVNNAASVVGSAQQFFAPSPTVTAGAAITTMIGLRVNAQKVAGVTTGRAIYATGVDDASIVAGSLFVGSDNNIHASARLEVDGCFKLKVWTVGTLPTGVSGLRSMVSDALSPTFMAAVSAGGSVLTPVYAEGTTWKVG